MFRFGRLAAVASSALLALMLLGPTAVSASTPGWFFTISGGCVTSSVSCPDVPPSPFDATPPTLNPALVKVGANAAWSVRITNGGTSNISALYLSTDLKSTPSYPTYIGSKDSTGTFVAGLAIYGGGATGPASPCAAVGNGPLLCSFGSLPSGGWVQIDAIAFTVGSPNSCPDSSNTLTCYGFNFQAFGNGNTPSDKGNKSHGDTLNAPVAVKTTTSGNYGGGFSVDTNPVSNDQLSKNNLQSETVTPPTSLIQVTIEDGLGTPPVACTSGDTTLCASGVGDWMRLNVDKGAAEANGIRIVINVSGKNLPAGTTASDLTLIHVTDSGFAYVVPTICTSPSFQGYECYTVTKNGSNFQVMGWLMSNGGLRI